MEYTRATTLDCEFISTAVIILILAVFFILRRDAWFIIGQPYALYINRTQFSPPETTPEITSDTHD